MTDLKTQVEAIYQDHQPLQNLHHQMISRNSETDFRKLAEAKTNHLSSSDKKRILDELFAWGPVEGLRSRTDIFDIIIQGKDKIYFETLKGMEKLDDCFLTTQSFQNFVERISNASGVLVNQKDPFGNGKVDSFRLHIVTPPAALETTITLRRHNTKILKFDDYVASGFLSKQQKEWLEEQLILKKNLLVVGPTGSGKTTLLNTLISHCDTKQRIISIEDTDELQSSHPFFCKLLSREICPQSLTPFLMEDLVKQALRMRPDRLVIGEVRGQEAKDLLQALATGHTGSMGTLHAESAKQALLRIEMLVQMGAPQWSLHSIRQLIQMSLDYLVVLKDDRLQKGIKEICKIGSHESFGLLLEKMKIA